RQTSYPSCNLNFSNLGKLYLQRLYATKPFSYCLSKSDNEAVAKEASLAMGGYFQNGSYDENAYKNIKLFIEKGSTESKDVYQSTGKPAILMNCLKLYNSNKYEQVVQNQKKYIID
ncbi:hypothetical protein, partial [Acinetobacter baumannii]|uniref:hypothetical protein n=1 Tax=Acinetobacter baumannii TaxID=470 RepID=UPI0016601C81